MINKKKTILILFIHKRIENTLYTFKIIISNEYVFCSFFENKKQI